jgi:DNA-binding NarL/FixJ family response regulator
MAMKLKVLLADDHRLFRDGLRTLLKQHDELEVVGETVDGPETVLAVMKLKPDIILMDISMPNLNGIDATRKILADRPTVKVIMLSMHSDQRYVIESLRAGATGYLLKDCAVDELMAAILIVAKDQIYLARSIAKVILRDYINLVASKPGSVFSTLSAREREVLQLLAEGKSTKEISSQLQVSVKTVETHRKQIMDKLNIHSIAQLTKYAIREGLTPLE